MYSPVFTGNQTFTNSTFHFHFNDTPRPQSSDVVKTGVHAEVLNVSEVAEKKYEAHKGDSNVYQIIRHPKGRVLLINNAFESSGLERKGSERDVKAMYDLWTGIRCEVTTAHDLTKNEIVETVSNFVKTRAEFVAIVIMSHGEQGDLIWGKDKGKAEVQKIFNVVVNSKSLEGKPKLLFFQMCRGTKLATVQPDAGGLDSDDSKWGKNLLELLLFDERSLSNNPGPSVVADIPSRDYVGGKKDILLAFSCMPDHLSFRDIAKGSWFIQSLAEVFFDRAHEDDVVKMMDCVEQKVKTHKVEDRDNKYYGAIASVDVGHTFDKKLFLFPGLPRARAKLSSMSSMNMQGPPHRSQELDIESDDPPPVPYRDPQEFTEHDRTFAGNEAEQHHDPKFSADIRKNL